MSGNAVEAHTLLANQLAPAWYQATRRIRSDKAMFNEYVRQLSIIALTASAITGDTEKCFDAGFDDFLTKPTARDDLKRTLLRRLVTPRIRGLERSRSAN